jgi:Holliday junction resolvase RusA-like endonuclease
MRIEINLPGLPKTTNASTANWRAVNAERSKWKKRIYSALKLRKLIPLEPLVHAKISLIRYSSSRPDYDGLVSSFKAILDGLVEAGLIKNDTPENIGVPVYAWRKESQRNGHIKIIVEDSCPIALKSCTFDQDSEI